VCKTGWSILALLNDLVYRYGDYDRMALAMTLGLDHYFRAKYTDLIPEDKRRVLDLGSGTGRNVPHVLRRENVDQIVLLDISVAGLRHAWRTFRDKLRIDVICGSAEQIPGRDSGVAVVLSSYMLRQVKLASTLIEIRRVLKNEGVALLVDFWRSISAFKTVLLLLHLAVIVPVEALLFSPRSWRAYCRLWRELLKLPSPVQIAKLCRKIFRKVELFTFNNFIFVWVVLR